MKEIKSFKITKLLGLASVEFHSLVTSILLTFMGVFDSFKDLINEYAKSVDLQQQASNKNMRLANTDAINEKDKVRDAYVSRFFKSVKDFQRSPDTGEKKAANIIYNEISRFEGLTSYEKNKETGFIKNLLITLQMPDVWNAVNTLRLEILFDQISEANADFEREMNIRFEGELLKDDLNAKQQRKMTEDLYNKVIKHVNAYALVNPSGDTDECIDRINVLIDEYERTIAHMRPGGSGNESLPKTEKPEVITEEDGTDEEYPDKEE